MPHALPDLPFAPDALEPVIDAETMRIHHGRHHAGYVNKLNDAISGTEWADRPIEETLRRLAEVPEDIRTAVRNNGGGHFNHSLFWRTLSPSASDENVPSGPVAEAIDHVFGSFGAMKDAFAKEATGRFGSGWAWLCVQPDGRLHVGSTANQDATIMPVECGGFGSDHAPILGLDVWEHAYYLTYQNERGTYVDRWWSVVDWAAVNEHFARSRASEPVLA